jgi:hypothetical protein
MPNPLRLVLATCLVLLGTACLILIATMPVAAERGSHRGALESVGTTHRAPAPEPARQD